jgi:hypothetical protein
MVSAGLGVCACIMPDWRLALAYPVRVLPLQGEKPVKVSLVCRPVDAESRLLRAVCDGLDLVLQREAAEAAARGMPASMHLPIR